MTQTQTSAQAGPTPAPTATDTDTGLDVVTGAFSYSGRAIATRLLDHGRQVRTLTAHPERATQQPGEASSAIEVAPFAFQDPAALARSLDGATTLYNTYWVRFARGSITHESAVANSKALFAAAARAGVERVVHVSITNPSSESPDSYFRGKAAVEQELAATGLSYAIVRPGILFGGDGVLVNNIAWLLRRFPVFAIAGDGGYRLRPIHVDDLAALCVRLGPPTGGRHDDVVVDAVGPERPSFDELVAWIAAATGSHARAVHLPSLLVAPLAAILGRLVGDVLLTGSELRSMMEGRADSDAEATGTIRISDWIARHGEDLGRSYANELDRHFRPRRR